MPRNQQLGCNGQISRKCNLKLTEEMANPNSLFLVKELNLSKKYSQEKTQMFLMANSIKYTMK